MAITFQDKNVEPKLERLGACLAKLQGKSNPITKRAVMYLIVQRASKMNMSQLHEFLYGK